jgi:hypothetical protein
MKGFHLLSGLIIILLISCAPQVRPDIGSTSHPSEDEEAPVLIDQADWSWATRQGERRNFEQTKSALKAAMEEQGISGLSLVMKIGEKWSQNPSRYILDLGVENPETVYSGQSGHRFRFKPDTDRSEATLAVHYTSLWPE